MVGSQTKSTKLEVLLLQVLGKERNYIFGLLFFYSIHSSCRRQAQQELEENSEEDSGKRCS